MARKNNSEVSEGTIVVGFSLLKELKPRLGELAAELGLKTQSDLLTMLAVDVQASAQAVRPLLEQLEAHKRLKQAERELRRERLGVLQSLSNEELERAVSAATAGSQSLDSTKGAKPL